MKNIYTLVSVFALASTVTFAQSDLLKKTDNNTAKLSVNEGSTVKTLNTNNKAVGDTVWSEDFGGGMPAGWTVVDNNFQGLNWRYANQPTLNNPAPNGYTNNLPTIPSTTNANGFMLLFGDSLNYACVAAGTCVDMDAYFQTTAIPMGAASSYILKFQTEYRTCCQGGSPEFLSVRVSSDPTFPATAATQTWEVKNTPHSTQAFRNMEINISAIAVGAPNIYIRFHQTNASHYYWEVDDLAITEGSANDILLTEAASDFWYQGGGHYTEVPTWLGANINFRGMLENFGSAAQTNVKIDVTGAGANSYTATSNTINSMPSLAIDTVYDTLVTWDLFNAVPGVNTIDFVASQTETDDNPNDNMITGRTFNTSQSSPIYSRDYGTPTSSISTNQWVNGDVDGSKIGIIYTLPQALANGIPNYEIVSIDVYISANADVSGNAIMIAHVEDAATTPADWQNAVPVASSDPTPITTAGGWVTFPLTDGQGNATAVPYSPTATGDYFISVEMYGLTAGLNMDIGEAEDSPQSDIQTLIKLAGGTPPITWGGAAAGIPMIRINVPIASHTEEFTNDMSFSVFPNPSTGEFNISLDANKASTVSFTVRNVVGQTVLTKEVIISGSTKETISLSNYDKGVYFLTVESNGESKTAKLIVE